MLAHSSVLLNVAIWPVTSQGFQITKCMIRTLKKCNKNMGSPSLFTRQLALKLGYFYRLGVKNSNPLLTE